MPLVLLLIGVAVVIIAAKNNQATLAGKLAQDVSGGFIPWLLAVAAIGALGYVPGLKGFSRGILGLLLLVFILKNGSGLFDQLKNLSNTQLKADPSTVIIDPATAAGAGNANAANGQGAGLGSSAPLSAAPGASQGNFSTTYTPSGGASFADPSYDGDGGNSSTFGNDILGEVP
jgi:hypothetical protein